MAVKIIEELRQIAFPNFPWHRFECGDIVHDDGIDWDCNRQVDHEGPHMSVYEYDGEVTVIGLAWTDTDDLPPSVHYDNDGGTTATNPMKESA